METRLSYAPEEIICPVDRSELSDLALKYAYVGARLFNASLTILHAMHFDYPRYLSRELTAKVLKELENAKAAARDELEDHVGRVLGPMDSKIPVRYQASDSEPVAAIMQALAENHADLVVMGTHGYSGFKQWMLGSVTESVLHRARVPVFTVRQKVNDFIDATQAEARPNIRHILCPCNMTVAAGQALQVAAALAGRLDARLTAMWSMESATAADENTFSAWVQKTIGASPNTDSLVQGGSAASQAIALAGSMACDLIVIGAHHKPFDQGTVVGRTTELVLRHASVPVLAVPFYSEQQ